MGAIQDRLVEKEVLRSLIEKAVRERVEGEEVGVLFSGGLDSTVIAYIANGFSAVTTYTVGVEGSHDILVSERTSRTLSLDWTPIFLTEEQICSSIKGLQKVTEINDPLTMSFQLPTYVVACHAKERILMNGQGADELFGGYARYGQMDMAMLEKSMQEDLDKVICSGSILDRKIAAHFGKIMVHPYLDAELINYVRSLPFELRFYRGERKALLRSVARSLGLDEVAERPKKAAQYGSGIMKSMKMIARKRGLSLRELIIDLSAEEKES